MSLVNLIEVTEPASGARVENLVIGPRSPGLVVSFLAADSGSKVGAVVEILCRTLSEDLGAAVLLARFDDRGQTPWRISNASRLLDGETWGAFVEESEGFEQVDTCDVHPRHVGRLLNYAEQHFEVICANLSGAKERLELEVLRASSSIFLVSGSQPGSLELVREKHAWLRSLDLDGACGILLIPEPGGVSPIEAEEITGLPVSSLIGTREQFRSLALWLRESAVCFG